MTQSRRTPSCGFVSSGRPPKIPGICLARCDFDHDKTQLEMSHPVNSGRPEKGKSQPMMSEAELSALWSQVCLGLMEKGPSTTEAGTPVPGAMDLEDSIAFRHLMNLPAASAHSLGSSAASVRTTSIKDSPCVAASTPSVLQSVSDTPLNVANTPLHAVAGMVDPKQLRTKLEKLAAMSQTAQKTFYARRLHAETPSGQLANKMAKSQGQSTPLSVQSVTLPFPPVGCSAISTPTLPSPGQLPWLQLSGTQQSMPSLRALQACANANERPISTRTLGSSCSSRSIGLPPLPGAIDENLATPQSLWDLARPPRVPIDENLATPQSIWDLARQPGEPHAESSATPLSRQPRVVRPGDRPLRHIKQSHSGVQPRNSNATLASLSHCRMTDHYSSASSPSNQGSCAKRSRLKRLFSRLWRSRRSTEQSKHQQGS